MPNNVQPACSKRSTRGFTLIEMLVVLFIIGILSGIVITVAQRVTQGGKFSTTKNVLQIGDSLVTEYIAKHEGAPPAFVKLNKVLADPQGRSNDFLPDYFMFPIVDGRFTGRTAPPPPPSGGGGNSTTRFDKDLDPAQPSGALLLAALIAESADAERDLKGVDAKFVKRLDLWAYGWWVNPQTNEPQGQLQLRRIRIPALVDAFGNPIRYVHPNFQGGAGDFFNNNVPPTSTTRAALSVVYNKAAGQPLIVTFSRSYRPFMDGSAGAAPGAVGDADEGLAVGTHGYFYSPGADGDPGTRQDNVYSTQPTFPPETSKLN